MAFSGLKNHMKEVSGRLQNVKVIFRCKFVTIKYPNNQSLEKNTSVMANVKREIQSDM